MQQFGGGYNAGPRKSVAVAYGLWFLCFLGLCGMQRFYTRRIGTGLLYLFTFGLLGIGQIIDLFLIPEMVRTANAMAGNFGGANMNQNQQHVTINMPGYPGVPPGQHGHQQPPPRVGPGQQQRWR